MTKLTVLALIVAISILGMVEMTNAQASIVCTGLPAVVNIEGEPVALLAARNSEEVVEDENGDPYMLEDGDTWLVTRFSRNGNWAYICRADDSLAVGWTRSELLAASATTEVAAPSAESTQDVEPPEVHDQRWTEIVVEESDLAGVVAFTSAGYPVELASVDEDDPSRQGNETDLQQEREVELRVLDGEAAVIQGTRGSIPGLGEVGQGGCFLIWIMGPVSWDTQPAGPNEFPPMTLYEASWEIFQYRGALPNPEELFPQKVADLKAEYPDTCGSKIEQWLYQPTGFARAQASLASDLPVGWSRPILDGTAGAERYGALNLKVAPIAPRWSASTEFILAADQLLLFEAVNVIFDDQTDSEVNAGVIVVNGQAVNLKCTAVVVAGPWSGTFDIIGGKVTQFTYKPNVENGPATVLAQKAADLVDGNPDCRNADGSPKIDGVLYEPAAG